MVSGGSVMATVTVTTTAASLAAPDYRNKWPMGMGRYPGTWLAAVLAVLLLWLNQRRYQPRITFAQVSALFLCFALLSIVACGGGSQSAGSSPPGGSPTGTTAGSYTLTVTAAYTSGSATLSHQTNLTLVVQ
jgi:hypothetical protein